MKKFILLVAMLSAGAAYAANQDYRALATCKFEGAAFSAYKNSSSYGFQSMYWKQADLVGAEFILAELKSESDPYSPSRLQLRKYVYGPDDNKDGLADRRGAAGAPLTRIGYSVLDGVVTISYTQGPTGSDHRSFQISTNGKTSTITYSQDGYGNRGYAGPVECEIHDYPQIEAPDIDWMAKSKEEKILILKALRYKRSRYVNTADFAGADKANFAVAAKKLLNWVDGYDFTDDQVNTVRFEWMSPEKCEFLSSNGRYDVSLVADYAGNTLGYIVSSLSCKNKVSRVYRKYDPNTGEPYEKTEEQNVRVNNLYFDLDFNLLNWGSAEDPVDVKLSRW
ncbi:MAG: hypothetical protein H6624_18065 [Bdellovibrionaceae bacterium]|nr:hypothetical protein [Bdellovibrionales bacterium]MCB9086252.1 hypothetical protein [Pseudobdellovibrionaceae bacterium]